MQGKDRHIVIEKETLTYDGGSPFTGEVKHEVDAYGNHRLTAFADHVDFKVSGEWAPYNAPCEVRLADDLGFIAFTEYFGERVVRLGRDLSRVK